MFGDVDNFRIEPLYVVLIHHVEPSLFLLVVDHCLKHLTRVRGELVIDSLALGIHSPWHSASLRGQPDRYLTLRLIFLLLLLVDEEHLLLLVREPHSLTAISVFKS